MLTYVEQRVGGLRVAGVAALSSLFGKSPEAKLREAAAEKKLQDKSQLAAGLVVLAASCRYIVKFIFFAASAALKYAEIYKLGTGY